MALSHSEAQVLYARYLKSGMTLEKFCKLHQVPYWDFSDWINQWEKLYGREEGETTFSLRLKGIIQRAYTQTGKPVVILVDEYDAPMLDKISPIEFVENNSPLHFPNEHPSFNVDLELPKPGTIIKGAKLTFPSGMTVNIPRITIKGLVLIAIMYEGNCTGIE